MAFSWYVIRSKPHKEAVLYEQLLARNIETFYPAIRVTPVNPRAKKIKPYFPNYLFVRVDLEEEGISSLNWIPYSQGLVNFGGEPAFVPDALMNALQRKVDQINSMGVETNEDFSYGDQIRVVDGILRGYQGVFNAHIKGNDRVKVLMNLLGDRQVLVELANTQIDHLRKK